MVSASEVFRFAGLLGELRDSADYLSAAASELQRFLQCDEVIWVDADFSAWRFSVWRASSSVRDSEAEQAVPQLLHHPAVESYMRDPVNLEPRRDCDVTELAEPKHMDALRLSQELLGHYQLSMVTRVDPIGLGRGWISTREQRDFGSEQLDVASRLMPVLVALDGVHRQWASSEQAAAAAEGFRLTGRELEVLRLVARGCKAEQIGRLLVISPRTVRKHLENTYSKLGCSDRLLAVERARRAGLLA